MNSDALILITYPASNGQNVTISPRQTSGHTEPWYTTEYDLEVLPGTEVVGGQLFAQGRIKGVGNLWKGNTSFIFAYGPGPVSNGDSVTADLRFHSTNGIFTMDLNQASGAGGVPSLNGVDIASSETELNMPIEYAAPFHG